MFLSREEIRKEMLRNNVGGGFEYTSLLFENLKDSNCLMRFFTEFL